MAKHPDTSEKPALSSPNTKVRLHLLIIGAGIAGLSAAINARLEGHDVTILEQAQKLVEVGAGLQVTPNATRLFKRMGIFDRLEKCAAVPSTLSVRRYDGTKVLAHEANFQKKMLARYDAPFWDLHRADLQIGMAGRARELGVCIRTGAEVVDVDFKNATVTLRAGEVLHGDLVLAADGLWSQTRNLFLQRNVNPQPTGDMAYRILLDLKDISDPELIEWVTNPSVTFWIGPNSHAVAYSLRGGKQFNIVLLTPDELPENVARATGSPEELRELFRGWDPILSKFIACVRSVDKWRLMHFEELETWIHPDAKFVMAGDACHPMLPYLAQGANSAVEDGAVFGRLLGQIENRDQIPRICSLYQTLRKQRAGKIAQESFEQRTAFHMPDGLTQEARDVIFAESFGKEPLERFPSRWTCPTVQPWVYGYDAFSEAQSSFKAVHV